MEVWGRHIQGQTITDLDPVEAGVENEQFQQCLRLKFSMKWSVSVVEQFQFASKMNFQVRFFSAVT